MREIIQAILFFPSVTKKRIVILLSFTIAATFFEGFGVAMLFPIVDFIEKGRSFSALASSSKMWSYIGKTFDFLSVPKNLLSLMVITFLLLVIRQVFNYLKRMYGVWLSLCVVEDIRNMGFTRFLRADVPFYDRHSIGELMNVLNEDGSRAGGGFGVSFTLLSALTIFGAYIVVLLALSFGMTLFALAIMGCVGVALRSRVSKSLRIGLDLSGYNERMSSTVIERLNGIRLIKLAATEIKETEFIKTLTRKIKINNYTLERIRARVEFMVDPMVLFSGLTILYLSVEMFRMTLAETGVFVFILLRLLPYAKEIFNCRQALAGLSGSLFRVQDLLTEAKDAEVIEGGSIGELKHEKGIEFKNVSFSYQPQEGDVLKDLNVFIPAGKMTALVGRSGAGKSTLVDLIPRLRVPNRGGILIDDVPIESYSLSALRRNIAFVSQEGFLFDDTIENNVRYGKPDATLKEIIRASQMAYADHFVREFSEGYQTRVGERGVKLSGGQKQRIVLARALLQEAKIIVLDEPTSALDSESERFIQRAIEVLRREKHITIIVIAHRLSTIKSADQIIVLDKGRVIECGSHGRLIHEDTWYADMVKLQAMG